MATTRVSGNVVGQLLKTAKFDVTADNDVLLSGDRFTVVAAVYDGLATALNIDAGIDEVAFPIVVEAAEELCVTASGAGSVTLTFQAEPVQGIATQNT